MRSKEVVRIIRDPIHEYISIYENEVPLLASDFDISDRVESDEFISVPCTLSVPCTASSSF